jgi:ribose transport system ATP-binding protein
MNDLILEMHNMQKSFLGQPALRGVDFSLHAGEIHALIGENGAGKTTLMNILGGVVLPDGGEILVNGRHASIPTPSASRRLGISFIHQELNLVNDLRVYENFFLGAELRTSLGFIKVQAMCARTAEILTMLDVSIDPRELVGNLDASYKQVVEIGRALLAKARILIMDEPTTSLTDHEIRYLFTVMRSLSQRGVSVIFISHKLKEVLTVCDGYTVLRDGRVAGSGPVSGRVTEEDLARLMVGREMSGEHFYEPRPLGETVLAVEHLSSDHAFREISFTLRRGEIMGFTGLVGDGRTELFECIFGARRKTAGRVVVEGTVRTLTHPEKALAAGIGLAPKNRKENALIKDFSVRANATIARLRALLRGPFIDSRREWQHAEAHVKNLNIKVSDINMLITSLSGGNQQKVVLAKWIEAGSRILILDNPTQGIDVGAKAEIYHLVMRMAQEGKSIIILSSEVPEILKVCDRVGVMYHGELAAVLDRGEATEESVMMYATGAKRQGDTPVQGSAEYGAKGRSYA